MADREDEMIDAELDQPATRRDIHELRHELRHELATARHELERRLDDRSAELRRHFDVVAESFKADFANLFDWVQSTTSTIGERVDGLESRVTRLERRRKT
jgi:hypothetical protein